MSVLHNNDAFLGATRVTVGASASITALLAAATKGPTTIQRGLRRIALIPASGVSATIATGEAATSGHAAIPGAGIEMPFSKEDAGSTFIYAGSSGSLDIFQFGAKKRTGV